MTVNAPFAEYRSDYSVKNGILRAERHLTILAKEAPASEYAAYRDFERKVDDDVSSWITFKPTALGEQTTDSNTVAQQKALSFPRPPDSEAGRELREGISLLQAHNVDGGLEKLQAAAEKDPKLPGVWAAMATAHYLKRDADGALDDLRRQAKETPQMPIAFRMLGMALLQMNQHDEALPVLRRWHELAPDDREALGAYGNTLINAKKYSDAVELYQQAVKLDPKRDGYQYQLGKAYLGLGKNQDAVDSYRRAIDLAVSKDTLENDAAFELAEQNVELAQAESWAKQAVQQVETESQEIDLGHLALKDARLMNSLAYYWDTLGWVYFRKCEYPDAERYLLAGWWLRQNADIGKHVAQVYEKLHQPSKAERFREMADASPDHDPMTPEQAALKLQIIDRRKRLDAAAELSKMRTLHLPALSNKSESAEFFVLLANEAKPDSAAVRVASHDTNGAAAANRAMVITAQFISGAEDLKKAEPLLRKMNFGVQFPDSAPTKALRRGILMCSPYTHGCEFTLLTADSVRSME